MPKVIPGYKEEARKRIIEAALEVFRRKGFRATRMEDIAKVLGISKGAIYTYFKNKDDLFAQSAQYYRQNFESDMNVRIQTSENKDLFDIFFDIFTEYLTKFGHVLTFEMMNLALNDEKFMAFIKEDGEKDKECFLKYLDYLQKEGKIRQDIDIHELSDHIITLFNGLYLRAFLDTDLENAKRIWDNAVEKYR